MLVSPDGSVELSVCDVYSGQTSLLAQIRKLQNP